MKITIPHFTIFTFLLFSLNVLGQGGGFIVKDGKTFFPIGSYDLPKEDAKLTELAAAGFNFIRCNSKEALDRAQSVGMLGWVPLNFAGGVTDDFKSRVNAVAGHPALAVWEGPDEIVWGFTGGSGLYRDLKVHEKPSAWWEQTPGAVKYATERSATVIPNMIGAISYIRKVDPDKRQVWINEACQSDAGYIRQYLDQIDITGCDIYPVKNLRDSGPAVRSSVDEIRFYANRFMQIGRNKPVYMVSQGFSWPELGGLQGNQPPSYPSFAESRYMAYTAIVHGAKGINYWGMRYSKSEEFLQSVYAVVSELSALQPFLTAPVPQQDVHMRIIQSTYGDPDGLASAMVRQSGEDRLVIVINESDFCQMGVMVENLEGMDGLKLYELYGDDEVMVSHEEISLRMKAREVKVFATDRKWETRRLEGRNYAGL